MRTTELQAAKYISKNRKIKNAKPLIQPVTNMIILVSVFMTLSHLKTKFFKFFQCFFFFSRGDEQSHSTWTQTT